ncbi:MAG: DUF4398 domain-containing protein [Azoarcus sp.]|nr:DUF4398 domain-containing protein [Azoarcus sp.]
MNTLPLIPTRTTALTLALAVTALVALGGCASTPAPVEKMAVAEAAIQTASTTSTSEGAPGELQIATAKLASARQAMIDENYERAGQLAEQAELDAQVAVLHAQSTRARKSAQESQDAARALRDEINRKTVR